MTLTAASATERRAQHLPAPALVRLTGAGIPADKLKTLFERFYQLDKRNRRGVGLGLYVSRSIVQTHGGRIWTESTVGVGSTFHVVIPTKP